MPRATWKGYISFALVNIPVLLYSGEKRADLQFDLVDVRDQNRIRYRRVNEETGEEVPWDQIVRAYEYADGNYVMLQEADFERANIEATKTLAVDGFIERNQIAPYFYEKPYIVVPQKGGEKAYVLLREAMQGMNRTGIAKMVLRGREYLMALLVEGPAIIADRLRFAQELTNFSQFDLPRNALRDYGVSAQELDMAEKLVHAMSTSWQPNRYHDEYREALLDWIDKKVRTGELLPEAEEAEEPHEESAPPDLVELLQRSLRESRERAENRQGE